MEQIANDVFKNEAVDFIISGEESFEYCIDDRQHFIYYVDGAIVDEETSFVYNKTDDKGMLISPPELEEYLEIRDRNV